MPLGVVVLMRTTEQPTLVGGSLAGASGIGSPLADEPRTCVETLPSVSDTTRSTDVTHLMWTGTGYEMGMSATRPWRTGSVRSAHERLRKLTEF